MSIHLFSFFIFALLFGRSIQYGVEKYIPSPILQSVVIVSVIAIFFITSSAVYKRYQLDKVKIKPTIWIPSLVVTLILAIALYELHILPS
ncbi:putative membrane protein [Anoxybacillus amylolyticus]|uniref:Putative membrane protein n=1 Tax=Anoxybacteroides amylolyticum TaxID=294699 RepID=A0A167TLY1_9BACL|nr:putative membrane protein [Anoxybacillus amylolyticus]